MKYLSTILFFITFVFKNSCDEFSSYSGYQTSYSVFPKVGDCYEIYDQNEQVTSFSCQKQADLKRQSCIDLIQGNEQCLGLKTPTNETVEFICNRDISEDELLSNDYDTDTCFKVHNVNKTFKTVCPKNFDDYSIGLTTPDNFTIILGSYFCRTTMTIDERKTFNNFVNSYSFDSELKSCYKVFSPNQIVSPYTCLNKDVQEICIQELPKYKNCMGIITQNNETILLNCSETNEKSLSTRSCFKIYTSDDNVHIACQKKLEERCVGFTTPSNLTVLLDCYYCSKPNIKHTKYENDHDGKRKHRHFVKSYLNKEYKGENSYLETIAFEVFGQNDFVEPSDCFNRKPEFYAYWLPNTNCYGLTLESNETIILGCTSKEKNINPGCFQVINSEHEETTACITVLDELCVGITTPRNLSVVLACYPLNNCFLDRTEMLKNDYANTSAESYKLFIRLHVCYEVYGENQEVSPYNCRKKSKPENYTCTDWIIGKKGCLGLKTPQNETIELTCSSPMRNQLYYTFSPCFNIYTLEGDVRKVCQKKFGNYSVGITTPNNISILFDSQFCKTSKTLYEIESSREFVENFSFNPDVRSCYKIFTHDQDISPYSCLNRDIYEACIHRLNKSNCTGIKTQFNETVVLHCPNDDEKTNKSACFKIYTSDNEVHSACQRQLEESCIGITTPNNLTVLFECHICRSTRGHYSDFYGKGYLLPYTDLFRKMFRKFVKSALQNYTQGYYAIKNSYQVFTEKDYDYGEEETVHLLRGHNNCRGLTLKSFETIVLECPNKIPEKHGCFDIYSSEHDKIRNYPEQKVQNVCITVLDERCVGIITPKNFTLALDCIPKPTQRVEARLASAPYNGMPPRM